MLHYKRKLCCPALWMLPLGNESVGIYSRFSLPLAKRSAGITWMGLAVKQSPLWLHGCRAAALSFCKFTMGLHVGVQGAWEPRFASKAGLLPGNPAVGGLGGKAKEQAAARRPCLPCSDALSAVLQPDSGRCCL